MKYSHYDFYKNSRFAKICEGNTPFQLLWKDANTSQYFVNTDKDGKILDQQEVIV